MKSGETQLVKNEIQSRGHKYYMTTEPLLDCSVEDLVASGIAPRAWSFLVVLVQSIDKWWNDVFRLLKIKYPGLGHHRFEFYILPLLFPSFFFSSSDGNIVLTASLPTTLQFAMATYQYSTLG